MRNATAYGASPRLRLDIVLNNLVGWAFTTGDVKILSDGTPWRPLVHIRDIARATAALLDGAARGRPRRGVQHRRPGRELPGARARRHRRARRCRVHGRLRRLRRPGSAQLPRRLRQVRARVSRLPLRAGTHGAARPSCTTPTARRASRTKSSRATASCGCGGCGGSSRAAASTSDLRWLEARGADVIFEETPVVGAFVIDLEPRDDERGFFARVFCRREFEEHGLNPDVVQCNLSLSTNAGDPARDALPAPAARGGQARALHARRALGRRARPPARRRRPTSQWYGVELNAENRRMLYVPEGCGHGFQTLMPEHRGALPGERRVRARARDAACAGTIRPSASTGRRRTSAHDLREGPELARLPAACRCRRDHRRPRARAAGARGQSDSRRSRRRRLHGPRDRAPDRHGRAGHGARGGREPAPRAGAAGVRRRGDRRPAARRVASPSSSRRSPRAGRP